MGCGRDGCEESVEEDCVEDTYRRSRINTACFSMLRCETSDSTFDDVLDVGAISCYVEDVLGRAAGFHCQGERGYGICGVTVI